MPLDILDIQHVYTCEEFIHREFKVDDDVSLQLVVDELASKCGNRTFDDAFYYVTSELMYNQQLHHLELDYMTKRWEAEAQMRYECVEQYDECHSVFFEMKYANDELKEESSKYKILLDECRAEIVNSQEPHQQTLDYPSEQPLPHVFPKDGKPGVYPVYGLPGAVIFDEKECECKEQSDFVAVVLLVSF